MNAPHLTRRDFTIGLTLMFSLSGIALGQQKPPRLPGSLDTNRMLDAWIRINADGSVTVFTGKVELGQGILTALAQIAAEELDVPLAQVVMISGDTGRTPNEGQTAGSLSVENSGTALRLASAEVRQMLLELAAKRLNAEAGSLTVSDGTISASGGGKVTYGELAAEADFKREATAKVKPKAPSQHKIVGQSIARLDIPPKVVGGKAFIQDMRLPGMLHGRVVRPPRVGSTLESFDEAKIKAMAGVVAVVRDGSFLGVVAEREEQAIKARTALAGSARWKLGPELPDPARLHEHLMSLPTEHKEISNKDAAVPAGAKVLEATFHRPFQCHASIGPSCALAEFKDGQLTVWTHSQGVFPLRTHMSRALGMKPNMIRCIHVEGSGCYGHNGADDVAFDAVLLARAVSGRPVRLQWMRDDEFKWEPYGPAMTMKARAAVADGRIVDWSYDVYSNTHGTRPGPPGVNLLASWYMAEPKQPSKPVFANQPSGAGDRNAIPLYDFPKQKVTSHLIVPEPFRVSALRTLGAYANLFATESFMDECALAAGADPVAFRLAHMKDERARAVIEAVAKAAKWQPGEKLGPMRGRGIGFNRYKTTASYTAVIVDVEVDPVSGQIKVPRAWAAVDSGLIINPDGLTNQIEGGVIQSASWTLYEEVKFDRNGILAQDWQTYPIMSMRDAPKVETVLINRPNEKPLGVGEASQGPTVAAIANAVGAAIGKRIRDLPFTAERIKAAIG